MLTITFLLIVFLSFSLFIAATGKPGVIFYLYLAWSVVIAALACNGFFMNTRALPPRMLLVMIPAALFVLLMYRNAAGPAIRVQFLTSMHILRLPVELCLYALYLQQLVPELMTFHGWNFDIIIGITAIPLSIFQRRLSPRWQKRWHVTGLFFLTFIVLLAVFAAPSPVGFLSGQQPNLAILQFPFTLLPAVVVPLMYLSHLLCLRALTHPASHPNHSSRAQQ